MTAAVSYAMSWQAGDGSRRAGRVEVCGSGIDLTATAPPASVEHVPFGELESVVLDRRVLSLRRPGFPELRVASLDRPGTLRELAERIWALALPAGNHGSGLRRGADVAHATSSYRGVVTATDRGGRER
jgi:hypothetical protein